MAERPHSRQKRLGAAIRALRQEAGLTQTDLANLIRDDFGRPLIQTTVSRWELGHVNLEAEQVYQVEEALKLPFGTLLAEAGYVKLDLKPKDTLTMLRMDPSLAPEFREMVISFYNSMVDSTKLLNSRRG